MQVSDSVISVSLFDVCYISNWNEDCLNSGRKIDKSRRFSVTGEDKVINIISKFDNTIVFSASLQHGSYHVFPIVHHRKIYIAATDF